MLHRMLLLLFSTSCDTTVSDYSNNQVLGDGCTLYWKESGVEMHLAIGCRAQGWVSVGFSPSGGMAGADIYMGSLSASGVGRACKISTRSAPPSRFWTRAKTCDTPLSPRAREPSWWPSLATSTRATIRTTW